MVKLIDTVFSIWLLRFVTIFLKSTIKFMPCYKLLMNLGFNRLVNCYITVRYYYCVF